MTLASDDRTIRLGRRLKLRDLHILLAVVQWGSMAKAASQLGMSQPAVSESVASLESLLGVRLLDRSPRGVEPTIYAEALLKRGHVIFDEVRQGLQDIAFLTTPSAGTVRVGCPENLAAGFIPDVVDRLSRQYPNIRVELLTAQTGTQEFRELRERKVDCMLGRILRPVADDDIAVEVLAQDRFNVVAGAQSPWARRRRIALADVVDEPWILNPPDNVISDALADAFRAEQLDPPQGTVVSFSLDVRMHLLATGRFLTILSDIAMRYNAQRWALKALPVDLRIAPVPLALFTLKNRTASPVVEVFVSHVRSIARTMMKKR